MHRPRQVKPRPQRFRKASQLVCLLRILCLLVSLVSPVAPTMSRSLSRTTLDLCRPVVGPRRPPTTYLRSLGARCIASSSSSSTTTTPSSTLDAPLHHKTTTTSPANDESPRRAQQTSSSIHDQVNAAAAAAIANASPSSSQPPLPFTFKNKPPARGPPTAPPPLPTTPIPQSIREALPFLRAQPGHYITFHIHGKPYLVTPGDTVRLPFHMPGVVPGDVLRLNRASVLGSRDFTLKPSGGGAHAATNKPGANEPAYIDERLYQLRAVVAGVESEPMREKKKTKRRNRKVKTVKTKLKYTVLRISELKITDPQDL